MVFLVPVVAVIFCYYAFSVHHIGNCNVNKSYCKTHIFVSIKFLSDYGSMIK